MAGITKEIAEAKLTEYLAAESAVIAGQKVRMNSGGVDRELTLADLPAIQAGVTLWNSRAIALARTGGGLKVMEVIPR